MVVRNPVRSFFANYNLKRSSGRSNRHTNHIKRSRFNRSEFNRMALADAVATRIHYHRDFLSGIKAHLPPSKYVFVSFEHLTSRQPHVRRAALRSIVEFLTANGTVITDADLDRAFASAQSERRPLPSPDDLTFREAFTPDLIRRYWAILGDQANVFGYGPNVSAPEPYIVTTTRPAPRVTPRPLKSQPPEPDRSDASTHPPAAVSLHLPELLARARSASPFPLIITMASRGAVPELLNFAESVRRSRGDKGLRELTVLATGARPLGLPAEVGDTRGDCVGERRSGSEVHRPTHIAYRYISYANPRLALSHCPSSHVSCRFR